MKNKEIAKLFQKIKSLGLFTNSKTHDKVHKKLLDDPQGADGAKFIATSGEPKDASECSECRRILPDNQFSYYQTRVKQDGTLMRSNALCRDCAKRLDADRKQVFGSETNIPEMPNKGNECPNCGRVWNNIWHRDHDYKTGKFRAWICGNCNMAKQDRRTPDPKL